MSELSRRHAFQALAVGAAAAAASLDARAVEAAPAPSLEAARAAVRSAERSGARTLAAVRIHLCRSWDRQVYLVGDDGLKGFAALDETGFALAAACQAAGRPVALQYLEHQPAWNGVGRFEGVLLAIDVRDLPGDPEVRL